MLRLAKVFDKYARVSRERIARKSSRLKSKRLSRLDSQIDGQLDGEPGGRERWESDNSDSFRLHVADRNPNFSGSLQNIPTLSADDSLRKSAADWWEAGWLTT